MTSNHDRMRNTARSCVNERGMTQQEATWYIERFYSVSEEEAQIAVLDATHPGGFEAWMTPELSNAELQALKDRTHERDERLRNPEMPWSAGVPAKVQADGETPEPTFATIANMRAVRGNRRVIAFSPNTGEEYSANPDDYWTLPNDAPLRDMEGEPMILVYRVARYYDALTDEEL